MCITFFVDWHINDFQQRYIEYMLFGFSNQPDEDPEMSQNTCKVIIKNQKQLTVSRAVHCTCD